MCGVDYDQSSDDQDDQEEVVAEKVEPGGDDDLARLISDSGGVDSVFPPLDGTAFYETICRINHSCDPNVAVQYIENVGISGLQASLVALRDIYPNEELVQSYIDCNMDTESRQLSLRDYGFICGCVRCVGSK